MARYSEQQKAALEALMKDNVYEKVIAILATEDMQALTMERIANEVGVSRGTLYNYFNDREAVVEFVIDRIFEPLKQAAMELAESDLSSVEQLTKIFEWIFTTLYDDKAVIVALVPAKQTCHGQAYRDRHEGFVKVIEDVIRRGVERGELLDLDPLLVGEILFGAVRGLSDWMVESGDFLSPEKIAPIFNSLFLAGLCQPEHAPAVI